MRATCRRLAAGEIEIAAQPIALVSPQMVGFANNGVVLGIGAEGSDGISVETHGLVACTNADAQDIGVGQMPYNSGQLA